MVLALGFPANVRASNAPAVANALQRPRMSGAFLAGGVIGNLEPNRLSKKIFNVEDTLRFQHSDENNSVNFFPLSVLVCRDVTRGNHMHQSYVRPGSAAAAVPAIAATSGEYSSDEILVERIAAGDKLAMRVLSARHRTNIYRWLLRFVGNETVAEDLLSDVFFDVWKQAGRYEGRAAVTTWLLSIARFKALSARRRRTDAPLDETIETTVADSADDPEIACRRRAAASSCGRP